MLPMARTLATGFLNEYVYMLQQPAQIGEICANNQIVHHN